jgi:phosphoribosylaminoimidazole-succinocarboxamide synthase
MNPYIIIGFLLALAGAGAGGFKLGDDHRTAAQAREQKHITEAVDAANNAAAQAIAKIKVVNKTIQNEVQREVQNNIVYRDCKHTPDGLRLLNEALTGSKPIGDSKLPRTDTIGR